MGYSGQSEIGHRAKNSSTMLLHDLINWDLIEKSMGEPATSPYDATQWGSMQLVKALILKQWYHLSDHQLVKALQVRLDFINFTGLYGPEVPEEEILLQIHNELVRDGVWQKVQQEIDKQLQSHGVTVHPISGVVFDLLITFSAPHKRPREEVIADQQEDA